MKKLLASAGIICLNCPPRPCLYKTKNSWACLGSATRATMVSTTTDLGI